MAATTLAKANTHTLKATALEESTRHGLAADGSFLAVEFIEEMPRPADAYYFPLDKDARGFAPGESVASIDPTIISNVAFDHDGAWIGTAVNNLWPVKTGLKGWISAAGGSVASTLVAFLGETKRILSKAGGSTSAHSTLDPGNSFAYTPNSFYTVSAYYRQRTGVLTNPQQFTLARSSGGALMGKDAILSSSFVPSVKEQWQRGAVSAYYTEAAATAWPYILWSSATAMEMRVCGEMLENKPFVSAYCESARAASTLAFNLHASIGLNWDEDYTICYWKKVHGTSTDQDIATGYNTDSIGRGSNTVGGGFRYWGKSASEIAWGFAGSEVATTRAALQYQWIFVVLRRAGTTLTLRTYGLGNSGLSVSQDVDDSTATPDRYVTQNNYDLQLGGFNLANPGNAYYRDLIVLKRALSNADIDYMYATKLKMYPDAVTIGNIEEGVL